MALRRIPAPAALALGLALALPGLSLAAPPVQDDPRDVRIRELAERVADLERALQGVNAQLESATRAGDLARGDVKGLQDRVQALEAGRPVSATSQPPPARPPAQPTAQPPAATGPAPAPIPAPAASTPAPGTTAEDGLTRGRRQLQGGDPAAAEATLTAWLASTPGDPKAGEAAYLRGRARALQSAWPDAAADYITALKGWPATWWGPDAVVELARALGRLGKTAESCQALAELGVRYPAAPEGARKRAAAVGAQSRCGA
jgi:TolA-binding protein